METDWKDLLAAWRVFGLPREEHEPGVPVPEKPSDRLDYLLGEVRAAKELLIAMTEKHAELLTEHRRISEALLQAASHRDEMATAFNAARDKLVEELNR